VQRVSGRRPSIDTSITSLRQVSIGSHGALGIEDGREILSFVAGEVPLYPLPAWVWADSALEDAARHLRALHDASIGFALSGGIWQVPVHEPVEVICHNDFAPHNLAFQSGRVVGAIDFDTSSQGPRIWDLAYLATRMVPLTSVHPVGAPPESQRQCRVQLMLDAYGSGEDWQEVVRVAIIRLHDLAGFSLLKAAELDKPSLREDAAGYERDAIYLERVLAAFRAH
jgi:hypothetical protein